MCQVLGHHDHPQQVHPTNDLNSLTSLKCTNKMTSR